MTWLEWAQKRIPTYPWKRDGCRLLPPTEEFTKTNEGRYHVYRAGDVLNAPIRGMNPHGDGAVICERGFVSFDVPFWAVKWIVFDRDKKCQDCGLVPKNGYGEDVDDMDPRKNSWLRLGYEVHHIIPFVHMGSNCTHNAVLLCSGCHGVRRGRGGMLEGRQVQLKT